jgi:putative transcriptional regulator
MVDIAPGILLISDPFLKDPNFVRSVVLVCEHHAEGSFGFVLNKLYDQQLGELVSDLEAFEFPLFYGGPVQMDTVHFLHKRPDLLDDGVEIIDGIYWGGQFEEAVSLIKSGDLTQNDIRFYLGYSGWGQGQLEDELRTKSWITRDGNKQLVFHQQAEQLWKDAMKSLGGEYAQMANYPIDPQLN